MISDALHLETINAYSRLGDFSEARERLARFILKEKTKRWNIPNIKGENP